MILKKLIGETMAGMGFVNQQQIDEALGRQQSLIYQKKSSGSHSQLDLLSESRLSATLTRTPHLGQILAEMDMVSEEQIDQALAEQKKSIELYNSLNNEKLGRAIEICSLINSTLDLPEVLHNIVKHVCRITDSVAGTLMLLDEQSNELVFSVPTGPHSGKLLDVRLPMGKGVAGWVAEHERPVLVEDVQQDDRFFVGIDKITGFETKTILCVPLKSKNKLIGVLEVINKVDETHFTAEDALLLGIFAHQAAISIENARLHAQMKNQLEEIKQAEVVRKGLESQLCKARKMEALGTMAGGIAHDFNNILAIILGYADMAVEDLSPDHSARADIEEVLKAGYQAKDLVSHILAFASMSGKCMVEKEIKQLFEESVALIKEVIPPNISLRTSVDAEVAKVFVDPDQIHKVLANICTNASYAMKKSGGVIEMNLKLVLLSEKDIGDELGVKPGRFAKFSIIDAGHGIEKKILDRIFDPYFTTREICRGRGLGLAVVHGIVKKHGGMVSVESTAKKGTVFSVFLPLL